MGHFELLVNVLRIVFDTNDQERMVTDVRVLGVPLFGIHKYSIGRSLAQDEFGRFHIRSFVVGTKGYNWFLHNHASYSHNSQQQPITSTIKTSSLKMAECGLQLVSPMPRYSFYPIDEPGIVAAESLFSLASPKSLEDTATVAGFRAFDISSRLPVSASSVLETRPVGFTLIEDDSDSHDAFTNSESTRRGFPRNKRPNLSPSSCLQLPSEYDVSCKRQRTSSLFDYAIDGTLSGPAGIANRRPYTQDIIEGISPSNKPRAREVLDS